MMTKDQLRQLQDLREQLAWQGDRVRWDIDQLLSAVISMGNGDVPSDYAMNCVRSALGDMEEQRNG